MKYEDFHRLNSPSWLQGPNGGKFQGALGKDMDTVLDRVRQAAIAGYPDNTNVAGVLTNTPPDALKYIGADRGLPRITSETDVNYAERLRTAWDAWPLAGGYLGLLRALVRGGFPAASTGINIIQKTKRWAYLVGDGLTGTVTYGTHSGFLFDWQGPEVWNQFAIVFNADVSGLTAGTAMATRLNDIIRTWKPAKARYMGATVLVSGALWGWPLSTTWGQASLNWGATSSRFIPPTE
jgi:hypothetical protein